ncbi:hypothetical protein TEA_000227 [Camellia sinensis var. sinensis]|uniref:PHD-type domain-containing protein n=1 Tax=Camellia sinensis var. sinensis TaxID=542762 RepID=A0A4S4E3B5_CAMSN|nr:hypothetical protein TEA_000227 [Camellia sinensis var. sinensis]
MDIETSHGSSQFFLPSRRYADVFVQRISMTDLLITQLVYLLLAGSHCEPANSPMILVFNTNRPVRCEPAGLSLLEYPGLKAIDPAYALPVDVMESLAGKKLNMLLCSSFMLIELNGEKGYSISISCHHPVVIEGVVIRCQIAVHQECYGVNNVQDFTSWVCRACETPNVEKEYLNAASARGALKPTDVDSLWVHVTCAWFWPEVAFVDAEKMEPAVGLLRIPSHSFVKV